MPERSTAAQVSQIGVEATPGTAVAPTRRLGSLSLTPAIASEASIFRPEGLKFGTTQVLNREWATVDGSSDTPTYEEVIIPLSGAMGAASVAQVMDGATPTAVYEWTFSPSSTAADTPKTFTLQKGQDTVGVETYAHVLFNSFGLEITRAGVSLNTNAFAQAVSTGTALTAGLQVPTTLTPILPGSVCVYMASTQAALSTAGASDPTKRLNRVINVSPSIEDRYNPAWFVNCSIPSFTTWVENPDGAGGSVGLTVEGDPTGMGILANFRAGDTVFLRIEASGPVLYNAGVKPNLRALFQWDLALKVENVDAMSDEDGIYAIPWTLTPVHDPTWGKSMQVLVRNKVSTL